MTYSMDHVSALYWVQSSECIYLSALLKLWSWKSEFVLYTSRAVYLFWACAVKIEHQIWGECIPSVSFGRRRVRPRTTMEQHFWASLHCRASLWSTTMEHHSGAEPLFWKRITFLEKHHFRAASPDLAPLEEAFLRGYQWRCWWWGWWGWRALRQ